jgi:hypothetical protein
MIMLIPKAITEFGRRLMFFKLFSALLFLPLIGNGSTIPFRSDSVFSSIEQLCETIGPRPMG